MFIKLLLPFLLLLLRFENGGAVIAMRHVAEVAAESVYQVDGVDPRVDKFSGWSVPGFMENYKGAGAQTANEYPISRQQVLDGKSVTKLYLRILADIQKIGRVDVTDVIELALTITNMEKIYYIQKEMPEYFLQKMSKKKEIAGNAAFSYILQQFLLQISTGKALRNTSFAREEEFYEKDISALKRFFHEPEENFREAGSIFAKRNYVHLRQLFEALAKGDIDEDSDNEEEDLPSLYSHIRGEHTHWLMDPVRGMTRWFNQIARETPSEMGHLYDLANLKLLVAEQSGAKDAILWKFVKAIALDVEFGRPFFYAQLLHEKLEKLSLINWHKKVAIDKVDIFSDLTRIVLTRVPVDLADIANVYHKLTGTKLAEQLSSIAWEHFPKDSSDGHVTLMALKDFVEWAQKEDLPEPADGGVTVIATQF